MTQADTGLPVEIVLHPSWWHAHTGITFDEDFFYHPAKRVESERRMEALLHERFGTHGLGADRDRDLPVIGAVHNAAGYLLSEMLGCEICYQADAAPAVLPARREQLAVDAAAAFRSPAFRRYEWLRDTLKTRYGYVLGDINWSGVLNLALDLRGQDVLLFMQHIAAVIERFAAGMQAETGTSSISVNRVVRHFAQPVFLHSECSNTMISAEAYERFILPIDAAWSARHRPFGIHHCGRDPHRFAASYAKLPHLDFLDVGWGGDVRALRAALPNTFLNLRLDPVQLVTWTPAQIRETIVRLVTDSGNPRLTGVCCINLDQRATDAQIAAVFATVQDLRQSKGAPP
ncbi:MAG: hypothetical protein NTY53_07680 [Kiritimatiellaeota bacterium]|nr:hypothetical protein [Kiritimatiellota bacterium]